MGYPTPPRGLRPANPEQGSPTAWPQLIESVRGHGGTLAHVLGALGTFRFRHGHWPSRLYLYPETLAALVQDREALIGEAADLLFHLLVLLGAKDVPLAEVLAELDRREGISGIAEKASRP